MFQTSWKMKCHLAVASGSMSLQTNAFEGHLSRPPRNLGGTGPHGRRWVSGRQAREASSVLTITPHRSHYQLNSVSAVAFVGTQALLWTAHPRTQVACSLWESSPNHHSTPSPLWSMEKLSSMRSVPGAKTAEYCCSGTLYHLLLML